MRRHDTEGTLFSEMLNAATSAVCDRELAVKALRAVCRWFGGQMIYLPRFKRENSKKAEELFGIMTDATDDPTAEKILNKLMALFGGFQIYVPFENRIFAREVAHELYDRYDGTEECKNGLCREYHISFAKFYQFWHEANDDRHQLELPFG